MYMNRIEKGMESDAAWIDLTDNMDEFQAK